MSSLYHWKLNPDPAANTMSVTDAPSATVSLAGPVRMVGSETTGAPPPPPPAAAAAMVKTTVEAGPAPVALLAERVTGVVPADAGVPVIILLRYVRPEGRAPTVKAVGKLEAVNE